MSRISSVLAVLTCTGLAGCTIEIESDGDARPGAGGSGGAQLLIDGSSTVAPITSRVAELYRDIDPDVQV